MARAFNSGIVDSDIIGGSLVKLPVRAKLKTYGGIFGECERGRLLGRARFYIIG